MPFRAQSQGSGPQTLPRSLGLGWACLWWGVQVSQSKGPTRYDSATLGFTRHSSP